MKNKYFIHLLFAVVLLAIPTTSSIASAQVVFGISVGFAPPPLPVYEQPICPGDGYIWTPGYWAYDYDDEDYYWVPGTWVIAPRIGFLWTPGYWGWGDGGYFWHGGYWGEHVGFYGGIDYGFGYGGFGYEGGRWDHDRFHYNTSVNNVNINEVHNTYNSTVINNNINVNRVSYNGGTGGIHANPTPTDLAANRERHLAATSVQVRHEHLASVNRAQFAAVNSGRPTIAATARPAVFSGRGVVAATAAGARPTNNTNRPANSARPNSPVTTARATNNSGLPSSSTLVNNNRALQNRNAQRDNAFAHSQINPTHTQGRSLANQSSANRPPSSALRQQQFNTQRGVPNNTQSNSRQFADRPANSSAPAPRSVPNNTRSNSPHFADRPSYSTSAPAQHSASTNVQNNSRQFANRPSYSSAQPQHNNVVRQQPSSVFHQSSQTSPTFRQNTSHVATQAPSRQYATPQQHAAPSDSRRPSRPQFAGGPSQQSVPQRSTPQSQPHTDSRPTGGNSGRNHSGGR